MGLYCCLLMGTCCALQACAVTWHASHHMGESYIQQLDISSSLPYLEQVLGGYSRFCLWHRNTAKQQLGTSAVFCCNSNFGNNTQTSQQCLLTVHLFVYLKLRIHPSSSQICSLLYSCILASTSAKACLSADVPSVTPSVLKSKGFCPQAALSSCMHSCLRHDLWVIACIAATPYILHTANTCSIWMLAEPQIWMLQRLEL